MTEESKNHFDLYRFLCFPWGAFVVTPIWFGIIKAIESLLSNLSFTNSTGKAVSAPWWCSWALFAIGEIAIIIFLAFYSYTIPKGKNKGHNIYILIAPESFQDDKYITGDFLESFERHAKGSIDNLNIVIPQTLKRETFNRTVAHYQRKHKQYWESNRWKKLHKKLKGTLYISGILKRRSSEGKEKFVFILSATIGYNNVNPSIAPLMIAELQKNFPQRILINKEFELEEFEAMSSRFATFSEYLIGWAHLVSGNIALAYRMHSDIHTNNKQSFFKRGALNDLTQLLHIELDAILRECKKYPPEFVFSCLDTVEKLFPNSDSSILLAARVLIMLSTDKTFNKNLPHAQTLLAKAKINNHNRDIVHANRAYVFLLKGNYSRAESEYRTFFKRKNTQVIENIIEYCNGQTKDGCTQERPTAYFVKALMLFHCAEQETAQKKAIEQAKRSIPIDNEYYHNKLYEMGNAIQRNSKRKFPRN